MTKAGLRLLTILAALGAAAACSKGPAAPAGPAAGGASAGSGVVAEVDGQAILAAELDRKAESRLGRLRQEEYEIRKQVLDEIIWERLLEKEAAKQKVSRDALVAREIDAKAAGPSPLQVESIYEQNRARFGGQSREDAVARIGKVLTERAHQERRAAYEGELRQQAKIAVRLEAPRVRVEIPAGTPSTGPAAAPVTIVEFTDYQCPFCHRAQSVVDEVLSRYQGKVRFVHLDFPLDGHPGAIPAARAARCAGEQGKFWEYHRGLMTVTGALDDADLKRRAAAARLDESKFGTCLASDRHDAAIRESFEKGESLGVTGTPAYFVNGRMISGARPVEAFSEIIDAELGKGR
jgi:protein-disulfide isomerase